jgi:hypothetical protein
MMDNFMDLVQTPGIVGTAAVMVVVGLVLVAFGVVAVTTLVRYFRRDEADQILERNAANATANRDARIAAAAIRDDEAYRLEQFEETGILPASRMDTLLRPAEAPVNHEVEDLLNKYQFNLELDQDKRVVRLTDRKYFELKDKVYTVRISPILQEQPVKWEPILRSARYVVNRRAVRQGIKPKQSHLGRKPKLALA